MKKYLVILILVALGVSLSFLLIPGDQELALMQFRDKEFNKARVAYEQRLESGSLTVDVVSALTNLHLQEGNVDEAILIMERFIAENPENIRARQELGKLYQFAQRPDDYLANLEIINELQESTDSLETMNEMYAASQQYDKQEPTLEALVGTKEERLPNHYRNLIRLKSQQKKNAEAIETYKEFWEVYPTNIAYEDVELLVTLQLQEGDVSGAYESALKYSQRENVPLRNIANLTNALHYRGNTETALRFMQSYEDRLAEYPPLAVEKAYILLAQNETQEARDILVWLDSQSALPVDLQREYIALLVREGEYSVARERTESLDFSALQESDIISLIEMALYHPKADLMPVIERKLDSSNFAAYPLLQAAYSVAAGKKDYKEKLQSLNVTQIDDSQKLQLANILSRKKHYAEALRFIDSLDVNALSYEERLSIAYIYDNAKHPNKAAAIIEKLYEENPSNAKVSEAYVTLAAKQGKAGLVRSWLSTNPNASEKVLRDIYFAAQNSRHNEIALDTVDLLAKNYQNDENFTFLIDAYIANRRYEAVLPYFRDKSTLSASDREDYLFVLTKLARKNRKYSAELVEFARKEIRRPDVSRRQKEALVYSLIDAGRPDVVLPFIEQLALTQGGNWLSVYADNLEKLGKHGQARDFRMKIAMNPATSSQARRVIAYQLLDKGYFQDAESLFVMMAQDAGPESTDVKQLMYLWGLRPTQDKLEWLGMRYSAEIDPVAKQKWATLIANHSSREDLLDVVSRNPSLVNEKQVQDRYFETLYKMGQLGAYGDDLLTRQDVSPSALRLYARTARGYNLNDHSLAAYYRLNEVVENDPEAMRVIGTIAFSRADYSEVRQHLLPYADYREQNPGYHPEDYEAFFYLAETMKRDREEELAQHYYNKALEAVSVVPENQVESISKTAQSLMGAQRIAKGKDYFEAGVQQFPEDRLLMADYVSAMVEQKEYDTARDLLLKAPAPKDMMYVENAAIELPAFQNAEYEVLLDGNEALLKFNNTVPEGFAGYYFSKEQLPWLNYATQSYNEVLVVADADYELKVEPLSGGHQLVAVANPDAATLEFSEQLEVRYQMLEARIGLETGEHYEVTDDLVQLADQHPENPTLLGYTANALNFVGRWKYAQKMLERANALRPENEDILRLQRDINLFNDTENFIKTDYEWIRIGSTDMRVWTIAGLVHIDNELEVGANLQHVDIDASNIRRIDGRIGDFENSAKRGELFLAHEDLDGTRIQASLYGNDDTAGLGLSYRWLNDLGMTRVYGEYHRPNWEFIEAVVDDANRDRIGIQHSYVHNTLWSFNGDFAYNRYNLRGFDDVARTVSALVGATRVVQGQGPYVALNYTIDAEYRIDQATAVDNTGSTYFPLVDSREVHTPSVIAAEEFGENTDGFVQVGYSFDRLGGTGPLVAGRLTHQMLQDQLEAQVRASYGTFTGDREGDTARVGGHLKWRF
jgi:hypothetical protein